MAEQCTTSSPVPVVAPVKGRYTFTQAEIAELRRLVREKQTAPRDRQKQLRSKMRRIGFYITDFSFDQQGFVVSDLDELIEEGSVKITDANEEPERDVKHLRPELADPGDRSQMAPPKDETAVKARLRRKEAAARYQPQHIDLLLVAEAPPGELDRYFYFEHVREQDSLFRYVSRCLLDTEPTRENKRELLEQLKALGVFLIDLQEDPRDKTPLAEFVPGLVERCRKLAPTRIVLIKAPIFDAVYPALKTASLPVSDVRIPFPGSGQQKRFVEAFDKALRDIGWERGRATRGNHHRCQ